MTDYELDARGVFTGWLAAHRALLVRIAVVTDKKLWHLVVSATPLASGTPLRAFSDRREALRYLADGAPRETRPGRAPPPAPAPGRPCWNAPRR